MHELSICQSVIDAAVAELDRIEKPCRLRKLNVKIGALRRVVTENVQFIYSEISKGTPVEGAELNLQIIPITARCRACGWEGEIPDIFFRCGSCGKSNLEVLTGSELYLDSLEVDQDEA